MISARSLARSVALPAAALLGGLVGLIAWFTAGRETAELIWLAAVVIVGPPVLVRTGRSVLRGHFATDVVAALAIATAIALRQPLAGLVVVLMQTGGEALERYAEGRASAAVRALEDAAPRTAHRLHEHGETEIAVDAIVVGDRLLVRPGDVVPCDGEVEEGESELDTARLTGEPVPRSVAPGSPLMSGMLNGSGALVMRASAVAGESLYARIVELVRTAQGREVAAPADGRSLRRSGSRRSRSPPARSPGSSPATRRACSRCSSWRRPARCSSPRRSRSSVGSTARPAAG